MAIKQAAILSREMGTLNAGHFTNYPPANQFNFLISALFARSSIIGSVIVLRLQIILADIGIIYFGKKILEKLQLPIHLIFLYVLNPLVIIELTGNLHFESVMLFFLLWSLNSLLNNQRRRATILFSLSVAIKLIPILFIPLFYQWFTKKNSERGVLKFLFFGVIVLLINGLLFLPFLSSNLVHNYFKSIGLWFQSFEFNASLYYVVKEIVFLFDGSNPISIIRKILPIFTVIFVVTMAFCRKNTSPQQLITALLFGISFYYFTTSTVHPWYVTTLVLLCIFTKYRFPIVWSLVIILSYQAYGNDSWEENSVWIVLEYLSVYGFLLWEVIQSKKVEIG